MCQSLQPNHQSVQDNTRMNISIMGGWLSVWLAMAGTPVQAVRGQHFPIARERLYVNYNIHEAKFSVDYACRYSLSSADCYCCGAFFHYIEQGRVCTRYCYKKEDSSKRERFCQPRLIVLPFNWGDSTPDKMTLDNGGRGRTGTQLHLPFGSNPVEECPEDPATVDTATTVQSSQATRKPKAEKLSPKQNSNRVPFPDFELTSPKSVSDSVLCPDGQTCVSMNLCPTFLQLKSAWSQMSVGSAEYRQALVSLKERVCHKKDRSVCCDLAVTDSVWGGRERERPRRTLK